MPRSARAAGAGPGSALDLAYFFSSLFQRGQGESVYAVPQTHKKEI